MRRDALAILAGLLMSSTAHAADLTVGGAVTVVAGFWQILPFNDANGNTVGATLDGGNGSGLLLGSVGLTNYAVASPPPASLFTGLPTGTVLFDNVFGQPRFVIDLFGKSQKLAFSEFGVQVNLDPPTGTPTFFSAFAGGAVPAPAVPTTGSAIYNGIYAGHRGVAASGNNLTGPIALTADFGVQSIGARFGGPLSVFAPSGGVIKPNDHALPGGPPVIYSIGQSGGGNSIGLFGGFFGPKAEETSGVINANIGAGPDNTIVASYGAAGSSPLPVNNWAVVDLSGSGGQGDAPVTFATDVATGKISNVAFAGVAIQPGDTLATIATALTTVATGTSQQAAAGTTLDFSTFGAWASNDFAGNGRLGVFASGSPTALASIPTTGTATYNGRTIGVGTAGGAIDNATKTVTGGTPFAFTGTAAVAVDFAKLANNGITTAFSGLATQSINNAAAAPTLPNFTGAGSFSTASQTYTATVSDGKLPIAQDAMSGSAIGRFFGPAAAETAGTWQARGNNLAINGAFGAKK